MTFTRFTIEQSDTEFYTSQSGMALVGLAINRFTTLASRLAKAAHSQEGFIPFLLRSISKGRELTKAPLLVRLDSAHDAVATLTALCAEKVDFIVKRPPRRADVPARASEVFAHGKTSRTRGVVLPS